MKMRLYAAFAAVVGLGVTAALVGLVGCETRSAGEAENYFDNNPYDSLPREEPGYVTLNINPDSVTVTNSPGLGHVIRFMAQGGKAPFTWELAVASAGTVDVQSDTRTALVYLYPTEDFSANVILVYDSTGHVALASLTGSPVSGSPLAVTPDEAEIIRDEEMAILYAMGGVPPYSWRVVYPERGSIVNYGRQRSSAVYQRREEPDQIIILSDAAGAAIQVTIAQPDDESAVPAQGRLAATVNPLTLSEDGDMAVCTATGGTPPYTWSTQGAVGSILDPSTGRQVVYQRSMPGDVAITVTDAQHSTATVIVSQPEPAQP